VIDTLELEAANRGLKAKNKTLAVAEPIIMGITRVALKTDSFLSAASFKKRPAC